MSNFTPDEKKCPFCAETIKSAATICKHCRQSLDSSNASIQNNGGQNVNSESAQTAPQKKKRGCLRILAYCFLGFIALAILGAIFESPEDKAKREADKGAQAQRTNSGGNEQSIISRIIKGPSPEQREAKKRAESAKQRELAEAREGLRDTINKLTESGVIGKINERTCTAWVDARQWRLMNRDQKETLISILGTHFAGVRGFDAPQANIRSFSNDELLGETSLLGTAKIYK